MRITVAGTGYVGLSLATLLAQERLNNNVKALDIVQSRVDLINSGISPIKEEIISKWLKEGKLNLVATTDKQFAYSDAEVVIAAVPTDYDEEAHFFNTSALDDVISNVIEYNKTAPIFIKSTIPVGYVKGIREKYNKNNIYFSPEFLREGRSLYDNLHPSRIIVGDKGEDGKMFANLLKDAAEDKNIPVVLMGPTEAESVKLFANDYLAIRVAFFNELDTYAASLGLNAAEIITGVSYDTRIGNYYNNPSFGYGGLCFPKDTKQLKANFDVAGVKCDLVSAVIDSNRTRKEFIANDIMSKTSGVVGIYKTAMKAESDNNRASSIIDVIKILVANGVKVIIYDPTNDLSYLNCEQINDFEEFAEKSDLIVANRMEPELYYFDNKLYTRDVFGDN